MQKLITAIFLALIFSYSGIAQDYEIRAVNAGNGIVRVEMRETSGTTPSTADFVTDIKFGLKWSTTYNVDLESVDNSAGYNIVRSGTRQESGGFHFQAFGANATPYNFPVNWTTGTWTEIMSIPNTMNGSVGSGNFEITEVGFNATTDPNFGVNLTDFTPTINGSAIGVALPIELLSFTAILRDEVVELNWMTASEKNFDGFELERSADGINWGVLAFIHGRGTVANGTQDYTYLDQSPFSGINYYRLKQLDLDQNFDYSPVRTVQLNTAKEALIVYPIPATDFLQIDFSDTIGNAQLHLFDANGRLVEERMLAKGTDAEQLQVGLLPRGTYFLHIKSSGLFHHRKIILQ